MQASNGPFPVELHSTNLIPLATNCDNTYEMLSSNEAYQIVSAQGFYWDPVMAGPLPSKYHSPPLPKGKQDFRINHIACSNNLGTVNYEYNAQNKTKIINPQQ